MATELSRLDGVEPLLLANRRSYAETLAYLNGMLSEVPVRYMPGPERWMRLMLLNTPLVAMERWAGEVDWVYCPKEQPVATRRARLAVTVHDVLPFEAELSGIPAPSRWTRTRWWMTMRQILRRADLIVTVSQFTRQRLLEMFEIADEHRVQVIGNGVAETFFRVADDTPEAEAALLDRYNLSPRGYTLTVGSLTYRKNGEALLRVADRLATEGRPLQLLITGRRHDSELVAQLEQRQRANSAFPLRLLGYVPDDDLAVLLSHSMAMLFPSRYEGFGIPVLEAMAAGAPVISSRAGALPEVLGGVGIEVDGEDDAEMANALQRLERDDALRADLIARGRTRATEFTWQRCAERLLAAMRART